MIHWSAQALWLLHLLPEKGSPHRLRSGRFADWNRAVMDDPNASIEGGAHGDATLPLSLIYCRW